MRVRRVEGKSRRKESFGCIGRKERGQIDPDCYDIFQKCIRLGRI